MLYNGNEPFMNRTWFYGRPLQAFVLLLCLSLAMSARADEKQVQDYLRQKVTRSTISPINKIFLRSSKGLKEFYGKNQYEPVWSNRMSVGSDVKEFFQAIALAPFEGLSTNDYHLKPIEAQLQLIEKSPSPEALANLDLLVSDAFLSYATHLAFGKVNRETQKVRWYIKNDQLNLVEVLDQATRSGKIVDTLMKLLPQSEAYSILKKNLVDLARKSLKVTYQKIPAGSKMKLGQQSSRVKLLKERLAQESYIGSFKSETPLLYDEEVVAAVKAFQSRHGLDDDGEVGPSTLEALNTSLTDRVCQIKINMDRMRSLDEHLNGDYFLVNIPDFMLHIYESNKEVMNMKVIVGRRDRKSPVLDNSIKYIVFSPFWHVPESIAVKDKLPAIKKKGASYVRNLGMTLYEKTQNGYQQIAPESVNWDEVTPENFHYRLKQAPGAGNALGRIKFMFPNKDSVYLHDTPTKYLFNRTSRMFSSGCIRVQNPLDLAEYVLKPYSQWNRDKIKKAMNAGERSEFPLKKFIPIHIAYLTTWVDEAGNLQFRNDVYQYDRQLKAVLCQDPLTELTSSPMASRGSRYRSSKF